MVEEEKRIKIYQIYYRTFQRLFLDGDFIPYDNRENARPELAEYHIFHKEHEEGRCFDAEYVGFLSWKFGNKTKVKGRQFIRFIEQNPGYDVYFINPFPIQVCQWRNVWAQGDYKHPGILKFSQSVFDNIFGNYDIRGMINTDSDALYCNYWVANQKFWKKYIESVRLFMDYVEKDMLDEEKEFVYGIANPNNNSIFIPYIIERMFSTMIYYNEDVKYLAYNYSDKEMMRKYGSSGGVIRSLNEKKSSMLSDFNDGRAQDNFADDGFFDQARQIVKREKKKLSYRLHNISSIL